ncbi:hypothetical protein TBLA_0C00880 [Henningerozyma blattae CBS 6284]|uniref:Holocytochrome c-type synthase n=1 Tax=Henningerozyma blattae (strain ATCC 34711 / CBS 6284 / DSM 70876 / NBRC 10599 / NRRL Y-10934 / UCD 77-7) TaxID=1071380 RepID=I2H0K0_HENB6|nr:hypothetical protein TBLA_0C00880 [Tetrapisispora blattae CBS 6284]CCH59902.1 hypothetical protein TBLA_0C00880 [Tetrapisispora blattae CBS 6284]
MSDESKCPVSPEARQAWLDANANATATATTTTTTLDAHREISSIPRTDSHSNWIYPSEKQFYDAMVRKNWNPSPHDMQTVVPIHNSVNERVWNYIRRWEAPTNQSLTLSTFKGNSKKLTPRAWMRYHLMGLSKPFDRHDWTIDNHGVQYDYVIDFYAEQEGVVLDVRPKLNSWHGWALRLARAMGFGRAE